MRRKKKGRKSNTPQRVKEYVFAISFLILAIILLFAIFGKAGIAGEFIFKFFYFLLGKATYLTPFLFALVSFIAFLPRYENFFSPLLLMTLIFLLGSSGLFSSLGNFGPKGGGWFGYLITAPLLKFFGFYVTEIILIALVILSLLIFRHLSKPLSEKKEKEGEAFLSKLAKKVIKAPSFKVEKLETGENEPKEEEKEEKKSGLPEKKEAFSLSFFKYEKPPLNLLEKEKGKPSAGNIRENSFVIKKTLESFGIPVEMSGVNVGPTVTQYTLKPAEGIKLSRITSLSNDLALALASHPIRIEAPIPGKSLVGIEVPNKVRATVRLRDLLENPLFQDSSENLLFALGKDVSGHLSYANLARMPHLLVAGATGTGKTIFLNNIVLSLIYRNSPEILRLLLIDPKRVEFPVYNELPHLLSPIITDSQIAVNAIKWLIGEMEKRFKLLEEARKRNIVSYNKEALKKGKPLLPYIVLIIDELADLMVARGREVEAGIVRLAQMARASGIHLVVATQRPSVEVITGLIKANITSRITFQVASQVDSRTVLDVSGAEKLLGAGDFLFVSAKFVKPRRFQAPYVSEKEVKRVVNWLGEKSPLISGLLERADVEAEIKEGKTEISSLAGEEYGGPPGEDPLYGEAKKVVIQNKRASASLLQRRLRIGYARAARLIDMLEERGVVGPSQGAKPREVYIDEKERDEEGWKEV